MNLGDTMDTETMMMAVADALYCAHACIREGIHEDGHFRQEALSRIERACELLGIDPPATE